MRAVMFLFFFCDLTQAATWQQHVISIDSAALKESKQWERAAGLKFVKARCTAEISVEYGSISPVLGTAFLQMDGNRIVKARIVINPVLVTSNAMRQVVILHELGHALGLGHTDDSVDVMYRWIVGNSRLSDGDKAAIRYLYGVDVRTVKP